MDAVDPVVGRLLERATGRSGRLVVLTGAGISAESGVPTFRGPEGYWTVGSKVHTPEQMATRAMFARDPDQVWAWYLYRLNVCGRAEPNAAHHAMVLLEDAVGDRFQLLTQNVDGLHARAGSTRLYEVHGNLSRMRCTAECRAETHPLPHGVAAKEPGKPLTDEERTLLRCPRCGARTRPHVLWFDETYDEPRFRFDSALAAAAAATLLLIIGTSGATTLPALVAKQAAAAGAAVVDVNPEDNPFATLAERLPQGARVRAPATRAVPALVDALVTAADGLSARRAGEA